MVNWPYPHGIAFNPNYRVLLGPCRLQRPDKSDSNATVNLHLYAYLNKKGIQALWSGSTWKAPCSRLKWSSAETEGFTYSWLNETLPWPLPEHAAPWFCQSWGRPCINLANGFEMCHNQLFQLYSYGRFRKSITSYHVKVYKEKRFYIHITTPWTVQGGPCLLASRKGKESMNGRIDGRMKLIFKHWTIQ